MPKRPCIICHMMTSIDGKIDGSISPGFDGRNEIAALFGGINRTTLT